LNGTFAALGLRLGFVPLNCERMERIEQPKTDEGDNYRRPLRRPRDSAAIVPAPYHPLSGLWLIDI